MGFISIVLGIITFFCFTGVGAIIANSLVDYKALLAISLTSLQSVSDTSLMIGVVGLFAFIGLLICINLVMNGLTYIKVNKVMNYIRRR